jgi:multiple antibiotic resistance protein
MPFDYAISAFLTLFVVVDPFGLTPTFLAVTDGLPRTARRLVAVRASIIAGAILAGSALIGDWLLETLQISLAAFRIAGGLLLFSIASEMVFGVRIRREGEAAEQAVEEHVRNVAAFPLAIPLLAGPGAITATVLLAGHAHGDWPMIVSLLVVVALVAACCVAAFFFAERISGLLGMTGNRRAARRLSRAICGRRRTRYFGRIVFQLACPLRQRAVQSSGRAQSSRGCQIIRAKIAAVASSPAAASADQAWNMRR